MDDDTCLADASPLCAPLGKSWAGHGVVLGELAAHHGVQEWQLCRRSSGCFRVEWVADLVWWHIAQTSIPRLRFTRSI